jgi:nickel transport protein
MPGRINPLSPRPFLGAVLMAFLAAGEVQAHRLDAQVFMLPDRRIQIESWFSNGDAAKGARVQVFGPEEHLLHEGQLNEQGVVLFPSTDADRLKIVISAGAGHRKELSVSPRALTPVVTETEKDKDFTLPDREVSQAPAPLAERDSGIPVKDVLIGVSFLLAVAAFALSLRNAKKLRALGQRPS